MTMKRFSSTKRIISLALALIMALGVCTAGIPWMMIKASADTWGGTISDPGTEYVASGNTVHLYSARALVWFINRIYNGNDFNGVTVYLDTDVNLDNQDFVGKSVFPYSDSRYFRGTFDGQNHTISNFKMTDGNHRVAMFRQTESATFRNVTFTNVNISSSGDYSGHAVLVGYHKSGNLTFQNVQITSGSISGYRWIGALAGEIAENSGGFLLAKCSHDLDMMTVLAGAEPRRIVSFGGLNFFTPDKMKKRFCSECGDRECRFRIAGFDGPYYPWTAFKAFCESRLAVADKILEDTK